MAILSNELMIGNWVKDEHRDMYQVTLDNIKWFNAFEPIPLTPEILEKCGTVEGRCFYVSANGIKFIMWKPIGGDIYTCELGAGIEIQVTSLHQLQNLYYALTGTELTYKPNPTNNATDNE